MNIEERVRRLEESVEDFLRDLFSLDERVFLTKVTRWSPRDVLAHLVGRNRYVVKGAEEIRRGQLPFYDRDPGENYSKVNAVLVREHPSRSREELSDELRASAAELKDFLRSLDPADWDRDYGVRHDGAAVTIRGTSDELIEDYGHHGRQIAEWREGRPRK